MSYRLVIFDYDGTLADSGQWFADNINRFAVRHKFRQVSRAELEQLRTLPTRQAIRALRVKPWRMPFIARDMRRAVADPSATPKLFAGAGELLAAVQRAGVPMAVVSSNTEANIRVGLGAENAARIAAFDCGASIFGKAGKLRRLARRFELPGRDVLCVGDDSRDIDAAHAAGLMAAGVTWGYAGEAALKSARPEAIVHSFAELAAAIGLGSGFAPAPG